MTPEEATALLEPPAGGLLDLDEARAEYRATLGAAIDEARAKVLQAEELLVAVQGAIARLSAHVLGLEKEASQLDLAFAGIMPVEVVMNGHRVEPEGGTFTGAEGELGEYGCAACDRTFATENGMKIHIGRQHRVPLPVAAAERIVDRADDFGPNGEIAPAERGYHCTDCNFGYHNIADLKEHVRKLHDRGPRPVEREERIVQPSARFMTAAGDAELPWCWPD